MKRPGGIRKTKKLQKPRMQTMAEMRMRRKLHSACAGNKHCCCSSELFCILWCPDAQVPPASVTLMPHYRFNFIMFCNQPVVAAGYSTPVRVYLEYTGYLHLGSKQLSQLLQNPKIVLVHTWNFPNSAQAFIWIAGRRGFGKGFAVVKEVFCLVCYFLVLKERKNKTNPINSPRPEG